MLNKSKGNMYPWVTHTWNPIRGKCPHDCSYCYMKRYPQPELHFDDKEIKTYLGSENFIFVGSSCDMWARDIPDAWIKSVLEQCIKYPQNKYLFQSKNPARFKDWLFPPNFILGTTIETNRTYSNEVYHAPYRKERMEAMSAIQQPIQKIISIEPIINFDSDILLDWVQTINPMFVSVGADSGNNHLPEPSWEKVQSLINRLKQITEVRIKDNLRRLNQAVMEAE